MRDKIVYSLKKYFEAEIDKRIVNIEIMLANPMAIHEHTDYTAAMELELAKISEYQDKLEVLEKYFIN
jgi:hypothetical protein